MASAFSRILGVQLANTFAETFAWSFIYLHAVTEGQSEEALVGYFMVLFGTAALAIALVARPVRTGAYMAAGFGLKAVGLAVSIDLGWTGSLFASGGLLGAYIVVFWVPYNVVFLRMTTDLDRAGRSTLLFALFAVGSAVFPLMGGFLLERAGYWSIVLFAIVAMVAGAWIAARTDWGEPMRFDLRGALAEGWYVLPMVTLEGFWQGVFWIAVPIGTLRMVDQGEEYGAFLGFLGLMAGVASLAAGRWSDRVKDRRLPLVISSIGVAAFTAALPLGEGHLATWSLIAGFTYFFAYMMMAFTFTLVAELTPSVDGSMGLRELGFNMARVAGGGVFGIALLLEAAMVWPLTVAAAAVLGMMLLYLRLLPRGKWLGWAHGPLWHK